MLGDHLKNKVNEMKSRGLKDKPRKIIKDREITIRITQVSSKRTKKNEETGTKRNRTTCINSVNKISETIHVIDLKEFLQKIVN